MASVEVLSLERVRFLIEQIKSVIPQLDELARVSDDIKGQIQGQIADYALSVRSTKLKPDELEAFFRKPYVILPVPGRQENWWLIAPKFLDIQFGWLDRSTESFNVYLVNRYVDWLGELPDEVKRQLGFKPSPDLHLEGDLLTGGVGALDDAWRNPRYRPYLSMREDKHILIKKKRAFELLAVLIKDGVLPFTPKPVDSSLLTDRRCGYQLRDYQEEAWKQLLRYSNVGVFYPASVGKTVIAIHALAKLKPPHLVVVPTRILQEQWEARIEAQTDLKLGEEVVVCTYHSAIKKYAGRDWTAMVVDEVHHLPADQFSKLSFIKRKCTLGLSATPLREDGREEYIFALSGYPVGLGWQYFKQLGIIKSPVCHVWILKSLNAKIRQLEVLLKDEKKTLIFCDGIELGKMIAGRFNLPHVYGATKEGRLETIESSLATVVSRVADEGVSIPAIERVIEVDFLFGSRRQELQRFTRLLHGFEAGEADHHVLMTMEEYIQNRKRIFSVMDKGFKIQVHREGVSDKVIEEARVSLPRRRVPVPASAPSVPVPSLPSLPSPPILDERSEVNRDLILMLMRTPYAKAKQGLAVGDIKSILVSSHIKFNYFSLHGLIDRMFRARELDAKRIGGVPGRGGGRIYFTSDTLT